MISKEEFIRIINRLKETDEIKNKVNDLIRNSTDSIISDFTEAGSLMICHEDIVVKLLEKMFNDGETLSYWIYELGYGKKYKAGCISDENGDIDISTTEKLYEYLIEVKRESTREIS